MVKRLLMHHHKAQFNLKETQKNQKALLYNTEGLHVILGP